MHALGLMFSIRIHARAGLDAEVTFVERLDTVPYVLKLKLDWDDVFLVHFRPTGVDGS